MARSKPKWEVPAARPTSSTRRLRQATAVALVLLVLYLVRPHAGETPPTTAPSPSTPPSAVEQPAPATSNTSAPGAPVTEAFRTRHSKVEVETGGRVVRLLPDDREGSPHQRFLLRVEGSTTVLVAHNLDLAPRIALAPGDSIELRGEYEWNPKGGVIHWTHADPDGRHEAGWVRRR